MQKTCGCLFILTFDEDDRTSGNHILTAFNGQWVKTGWYSSLIEHFSVLNTIQNMYGLPYPGELDYQFEQH